MEYRNFILKSEDLYPIPLDEEQLLKLKFTKACKW